MMSRSDLLNRITILLSGRTAEEIVFKDVTSGAANDLERATKIARQMVTELGMSEKLGLVKLGNRREEIFLGRDISEDRNYSEGVASEIDKEVKAIIDKCYLNAREILSERRALMDKIVKILLEREVLDGEEFAKLMDGEEISAKSANNNNTDKPDSEPEQNLNNNLPDLPEARIDKLPDDKFMA